MARSDLLVSLVKAGSSGDRRLIRSTVEAIIAEERSKQHNVLAERLTKAMNGLANGGSQLNYALPDNAGRGRDFLAETQPHDLRTLCCQISPVLRAISLSRSNNDPMFFAPMAWSPATECCSSVLRATVKQAWLRQSPSL